MTSSYSNVSFTLTGEEFKSFKLLVNQFHNLLLVPASRFDEFFESLKGVDIDTYTSLCILKTLIDNDCSSDHEITKFLKQLRDL